MATRLPLRAASSVAALSRLEVSRQALKAWGGRGTVTLERHDSVATLTLDCTAQKNALTPKMMFEFAQAVDELERDDTLAACILRGAGATFCTGASFDMFAGTASDPAALQELGRHMCAVMQDATGRLLRLPAVSVTLVEGHAIGGGAELATCTDFRVWAPGAVLRFVQARMGLAPGWGGGERLVQLVGRRRALELLGGSRILRADEALEIGLADRIAASDSAFDADDAVRAALEPYIRQPYVDALRGVKRAVSISADGVKTSQPGEADLFNTLWGRESNLHAVRRVQQMQQRSDDIQMIKLKRGG